MQCHILILPGALCRSIDDTLWKNVTFHIRSNVLVTFCRTTDFSLQFLFSLLFNSMMFFPIFFFYFTRSSFQIVLVNTNRNGFRFSFCIPKVVCAKKILGRKFYESIQWCQENSKYYFVHSLPPMENSVQKLSEKHEGWLIVRMKWERIYWKTRKNANVWRRIDAKFHLNVVDKHVHILTNSMI